MFKDKPQPWYESTAARVVGAGLALYLTLTGVGNLVEGFRSEKLLMFLQNTLDYQFLQ